MMSAAEAGGGGGGANQQVYLSTIVPSGTCADYTNKNRLLSSLLISNTDSSLMTQTQRHKTLRKIL